MQKNYEAQEAFNKAERDYTEFLLKYSAIKDKYMLVKAETRAKIRTLTSSQEQHLTLDDLKDATLIEQYKEGSSLNVAWKEYVEAYGNKQRLHTEKDIAERKYWDDKKEGI